MGSVAETIRYVWTGEAEMPQIPLPDRGLSPEMRWDLAAELPDYQQAEFVRQEILQLLSRVKEQTHPKKQSEKLPLELGEIEGPLPAQIKEYLLAPFHYKKYRRHFGDPGAELSLEAWVGTYKRAGANLWLNLSDRNPEPRSGHALHRLGTGVFVSVNFDGYPKNPGGYIGTQVAGLWFYEERYRHSRLRKPYHDLKNHVEDIGPLAVAQELVNFATYTIEMRRGF